LDWLLNGSVTLYQASYQGVQIGRILAYILGDCFLLVLLVKITEVAKIIGILFPRYQICGNFHKEMDWATFSKTHLVTLLPKFLHTLVRRTKLTLPTTVKIVACSQRTLADRLELKEFGLQILTLY
jgi:hypothetical protein